MGGCQLPGPRTGVQGSGWVKNYGSADRDVHRLFTVGGDRRIFVVDDWCLLVVMNAVVEVPVE